MIEKYVINKITVTTMCVLLLTLFYFLPTNEIKVVEETNQNQIENTIYLLDNDNYVSKVTYFYDEVSIKEEIENKINILINGLDTLNEFHPLIPKNTKINNIEVKQNDIYIDFSKEFLSVPEHLEESMLEAIIYTLSEINGIDNIYITVESQEFRNLPNSKKQIPYPLNRGYGINKEYDLDNLKNINKTTIVFAKNNDDYTYYVPITKITNSDDEKINIIIEELKSGINSQNELIGYISDNLILEDYNIEKSTMTLVFNEYIYNNQETQVISEDIKYVISESIFENYDIKEVVLSSKNEKNVTKIEETP